MLRAISVILFPLAALAQSTVFFQNSGRLGGPEDPFQQIINAYWTAQNEGRFEDAVRYREESRKLLAKLAPDAPQFAGSAGTIAGLYSNGAMSMEARSILEAALDRMGPALPGRIDLLNRLADLWEEDKNLLKSLFYREKAVAALESGQGAAPPGASAAAWTESRVYVGNRRSGSFYPGPDNTYAYQRLAELYRKLGRPDAAAATRVRMRALAKNDDLRLAALAEQEGNTNEAAALYKRLAEKAAQEAPSDPWRGMGMYQSLARVYQRDGRYADAAAALRQAVGVLESSSKPEVRNQAMGMQQQVANALKQAGDVEGAERSYRQMLEQAPAEMQFQAVTSYANFLGETERAGQGMQLVNDYLARGAARQPWEESNALMTLSQLARRAGDSKLADQYQKAFASKQQPPVEQRVPQRTAAVSRKASRWHWRPWMLLQVRPTGRALLDWFPRSRARWQIGRLARIRSRSRKRPRKPGSFLIDSSAWWIAGAGRHVSR